ncbi:aminotransferase class IV [Nocardia pneumoniae]|uniref:aminotransferase class IV n=1 Tax=Nocardia pneumoniae TaxID=228601 RepID=UPI00059347ED|nr:aminotransferase class IV [Nocardia pneumoniae]
MSGLATARRVGAVWMDGQQVDPATASVPVLSFGLHNAACVFEGLRTYRGTPFAVSAHVDRLHASAAAIGMPVPWTAAQIAAAIEETVAAAGFADAYVRPVVWRGDEVIGIDPSGTTVHLAIAVLEWPRRSPDGTRPLHVGLSRWTRPAPTMAPVQAKTSANYLVGSLALTEARQHGFDDALLLDHRGFVAEATGANVFIVRDGELATPVADTFLDGITRQTVLRLAAQAGIPARVCRLTPDEVAAAGEVFLTGTAIGVRPVASFRDTQYGAGRPVTRALAEAYFRLVGGDHQKEASCAASG